MLRSRVSTLLLLLPLAGAFNVYPHAPGTVLDPRLIAHIGHIGGDAVSAQLAVEGAPIKPMTRDPGFGRPPFTSSRLRLASNGPVHVTLRCIPHSVGGSSACSFGSKAVLRGVGFDGTVKRSTFGLAAQLAFTLPALPAGQLAAHYYLEVAVHNASGPSHFERGTLFYFWIDCPREQLLPSLLSPRLVDVTKAFGNASVEANSSAVQTARIQRLLDTATLPPGARLFFPGPALYRTAGLVLRRPLAMELGEGATLQHPAPPPPPLPLTLALSQSQPPPTGSCLEPAFITVSATSGVYLGGWGGTLDANGFAGNSLCVADSANVTLQHLLVRGSASWSTHIFRSQQVVAEGIKILSGADGFDPDNSQDIVLRSIFVHSNDDAIAVKATTSGRSTQRVTCQYALLSTKKSCLKVGTESLSDFAGVLFADVEGFRLDRGLVLYAYDGGRFANISWQRVRFSSFYPYSDEEKEGAVIDFEARSRSGLSQLSNISAVDITVSEVVGSSLLKGVSGAKIQGVSIRNLSLTMSQPVATKKKTTTTMKKTMDDHEQEGDADKPFVFDCGPYVSPIAVDGLKLDWGEFKPRWAGVQSNLSIPCLIPA